MKKITQNNPEKELPLIEHIKELRWRIIIVVLSISITSILAFVLYKNIIIILQKPFNHIQNNLDSSLYITSIVEGFLIKIKLSLICGIVFSSPFIIYNIGLQRRIETPISLITVPATILDLIAKKNVFPSTSAIKIEQDWAISEVLIMEKPRVAIRMRDWKFITGQKDEDELYYLKQDHFL